MNTHRHSLTSKSKSPTFALKLTCAAVALLATINANADSISLTETQAEKLKCVTKKDANKLRYQECSKLSAGSYTATIKVSLQTLLSQPALLGQFGFDLSQLPTTGLDKLTAGQIKALLTMWNNFQIPGTAVFGVSGGDFGFSKTFAENELFKKSSISESITWNTYHKINGYTGECPKNKGCVKDGTVNISLGLPGMIIKATGTSDRSLNFGQTFFVGACEKINPAVPTLTAPVKVASPLSGQTLTVTIGTTSLPFPVTVNCKGTETLKVSNSLTNEQTILNNFTKIVGSY